MHYLHDVWVNWFEGEENGYNVCEFHEWRKDDFIEILDQVPVIKVSTLLFDYIENDLAELPEALLDDVYQRSYARKNNERQQLDYCFIAMDGRRTIVVNTLSYNIPIRKSRLIPRQEKMVWAMDKDLEEQSYEVELSQIKKEHHLLSPDPVVMRGLTRKERQLKQLLYMALDQLYTSENPAEIRYWCTEWFPKDYARIQAMPYEQVWEMLFNSITQGWSEKHRHICERLIKGHPFMEKVWELEHGTKVN